MKRQPWWVIASGSFLLGIAFGVAMFDVPLASSVAEGGAQAPESTGRKSTTATQPAPPVDDG